MQACKTWKSYFSLTSKKETGIYLLLLFLCHPASPDPPRVWTPFLWAPWFVLLLSDWSLVPEISETKSRPQCTGPERGRVWVQTGEPWLTEQLPVGVELLYRCWVQTLCYKMLLCYLKWAFMLSQNMGKGTWAWHPVEVEKTFPRFTRSWKKTTKKPHKSLQV